MSSLIQLRPYAESIDVGSGLENPDMGPHVSENELESTLEYIDIGHNKDATLETGGSQLTGQQYGQCHFVELTVFIDVTSDMQIVQEEWTGAFSD